VDPMGYLTAGHRCSRLTLLDASDGRSKEAERGVRHGLGHEIVLQLEWGKLFLLSQRRCRAPKVYQVRECAVVRVSKAEA